MDILKLLRQVTEGPDEVPVKLAKIIRIIAEEMNADAVIGVKYGSSQVMSGAAEVIAYGTAVKYK